MEWILKNIEWIFSGAGVSVIAGISYIIRKRRAHSLESGKKEIKVINKKSKNVNTTIITNSTIINDEDTFVKTDDNTIDKSEINGDWFAMQKKYNTKHPYLLDKEKGRYFVETEIREIIEKYPKAKRYNKAIVFLDVDQQTIINKVHGRQVGDLVLTVIASFFDRKKTFKYKGRCGDDTFFGFKEYADFESFTKTCKRLQNNIKRFDWEKLAPELRVSATIGYSLYDPNESVDDWLSRAAIALVRAKERGSQIEAGPLVIGKYTEKLSRESETNELLKSSTYDINSKISELVEMWRRVIGDEEFPTLSKEENEELEKRKFEFIKKYSDQNWVEFDEEIDKEINKIPEKYRYVRFRFGRFRIS